MSARCARTARGRVGLTSADPLAPPRIDPAFLSDPRDLATLMQGARMLERHPGRPAAGALARPPALPA
jgi:choline dehydrogenase-like flavoprotein